MIEDFRQTDPVEGAAPSAPTRVQVLADSRAIVIGVRCAQPDQKDIVSFSVRRDANLESEDHIRIVLGPFADGRSGYVFAVNPSGARYDALVNPGGESENPDWDGIWEAAAARTPDGWSVEIRIPVMTIAFNPDLHAWHFNIERRIQRRLENDRWASPNRQYQLTQTSQAGFLTGLPDFDLGLGLTVRPAITTGAGIPAPAADVAGDFQPSLDVSQRLGANVLASGTVNTDFAEVEVDTRRTNLTRFPLFFPEKRTFFVEGDDIFSFGLGLNQDVIPYFSRRIGLVDGREVPILAGGKVNGRIGDTSFGGVAVGTRPEEHVIDQRTFMGVGRVKQNLWSQSWVGAIATVGVPLGRPGSWLGGADFTYQTSHFRGDKNFLVGVWGLATGREDLGDDATAHGFKIDYPNDLVEMQLTYKRIGRNFDPSIGFVPRPAIQAWNASANFSPRFRNGPIQQMFFEFEPFLATDLSGHWESYRAFWAPINWRFRSGDRIEFNANPTGERLAVPFEVADGVVIPAGSYHWRQRTARRRHRTEAAVLRAGDVVVRRLLRRHARSVPVVGGVESKADRDHRVLGRAERRAPARRRLHPDRPRPATADQRLLRPVGRQLHAIRLRHRLGRDQHAPALDVSPRRRSVRRLQPQRAIDAGSLAARLESAAGEAPVRLAAVIISLKMPG